MCICYLQLQSATSKIKLFCIDPYIHYIDSDGVKLVRIYTLDIGAQIGKFMGQHGAHLGPVSGHISV